MMQGLGTAMFQIVSIVSLLSIYGATIFISWKLFGDKCLDSINRISAYLSVFLVLSICLPFYLCGLSGASENFKYEISLREHEYSDIQHIIVEFPEWSIAAGCIISTLITIILMFKMRASKNEAI